MDEGTSSTRTPTRRTLLGTVAAAATGFAGCSALPSDGPPATPGRQLEVAVYNFHSDPITFDVSVTQRETTLYRETISLEGVSEGHYVSSRVSVRLPDVAPITVSGAIPEHDLTASTTLPYKTLPGGFGFHFDLDDDGELGIWRST